MDGGGGGEVGVVELFPRGENGGDLADVAGGDGCCGPAD